MTPGKVTVRKRGRNYELFAPGQTAPFATKTNREEACSLAWTYARYRLGNQSGFYAGAIITEGFKCP